MKLRDRIRRILNGSDTARRGINPAPRTLDDHKRAPREPVNWEHLAGLVRIHAMSAHRRPNL